MNKKSLNGNLLLSIKSAFVEKRSKIYAKCDMNSDFQQVVPLPPFSLSLPYLASIILTLMKFTNTKLLTGLTSFSNSVARI